ncbi:MAG: nuclear transport factor 2 family protein [Gemmatimonas sp.]
MEQPETPTSTPLPQPVRTERVVEQASRESFPASDPPSFTPSRTGKASRERDDVPLLPVDESRDAAREWAERICSALDHADIDAVVSMLTEDAMVRVGSAGLLVGRDAARSWLQHYLPSLGSTIHHITDVRVDGDAVFVEAEVNVRSHDGIKVMRPEAISVRLRQGAASRLIVYGAPSLNTVG